MILVAILAATAFAGCCWWYWISPGFAPVISAIAALCTLVTAIVNRSRRVRPFGQRQEVSGGSVGLQAGGDISIGKKAD